MEGEKKSVYPLARPFLYKSKPVRQHFLPDGLHLLASGVAELARAIKRIYAEYCVKH